MADLKQLAVQLNHNETLQTYLSGEISRTPSSDPRHCSLQSKLSDVSGLISHLKQKILQQVRVRYG